ncbi:MAG TPA: SIMPL domain-containing protein [Stellaceae bacterium]
MTLSRRSMRAVIVGLGVLLAAVRPVSAQAPAGSDQPILHLSETAQRDVPRDLLHATLSVEASDTDAAKLQNGINQRMTAALARIKQVPDAAIDMAGYSVYRESPDKTPARWHGSQSVTLTSKDFAALLGLIGALQQQGLLLQSLAPDVSREARQAVEDSLTNEALTRLQQRADRVAAALGTKVAGFRSVSVGNVSPPPVPIRAMAMAAAVSASPAPPVVEPGSATVSVTLSGDIALAPR